MIRTKISTNSDPMRIGTPKSIWSAIAPPSISASDGEIEASMAEPRIAFEALAGK